ncbi:MAG TPA: SUMF1/EgtB/PvdO family nonheme iron enzyme [Kofleriaceae bacterium]|nr:SUMF1/EgtB/PvdO family nonheme iron enzyme [Kofleriaceae bacterium]
MSMVAVALVAVVVPVRPAASDDCAEKDRDERGRCPKKTGSGSGAGAGPGSAVVRTPPPAAVKKTQLEISGSDIAGIEVMLDGQVVGRAPLTMDTAPAPVRHLVEVKRDGYVPYAEWVEVKKGERRLVEVKLSAVNPPPVVVKPASPPPPPPPPAAPTARSCPAGMAHVAAGTFEMGNPAGIGDFDERPQHAVTLSGYCIDKTEVTVVAYAACVAARACTTAAVTSSELCNRPDRIYHPVNCVDWNQAAAYCKWAGKRLPTEAEWEYAARGNDGRVYPWGREAPSPRYLNMDGAADGWAATAPVGSFPAGASPVGALDMAGNVWEWTADWYGGAYEAAAVTDPPGAKTGAHRVLRGGSWDNLGAAWVGATFRNWREPSDHHSNVGFRCARGD